MKTAHHAGMQQPGDNLLNILSLIVVSGVYQYVGLRPRITRPPKSHSPVSDISVVESRLERLVLDQQPLRRIQTGVRPLERFFKPSDAIANALRSRIVRPVGKPR